MGAGSSTVASRKEATLAAFKALDKDGDGKMTKDEVREFLQKEGAEVFTDEVCEALYKEANTDTDGTISVKEFTAWLEKQAPLDILTEEAENGLASFTWCRPRTLNCTTLDMVVLARQAVACWSGVESVNAILMSGEGDRAFSSGADVKFLREALLGDPKSPVPEAILFQYHNFVHEIRLLEKPTVALMDGVTMGGGLGVACSARYRVATESVRLAMPNPHIGFFASVLFSYMAANTMPPGIGRLMAITGCHIIGAKDALSSGLATHFVPKAKLAEFTAALRNLDFTNDADAAIRNCISDFAQNPPAEPTTLSTNQEVCDGFAKAVTLKEACTALEEAAAASGGWPAEVLKDMRKGAPFSQAVTWRLLRLAEDDANAAVPEPKRRFLALERDFATACRVMYRPDFCEGVRVVLVDKGATPVWQPPDPNEIPEEILISTTELSPVERQLGIL